ncbi:MAG: hypothetical protein IPP83_17340 [Flavobacteriales bacterium]|nr:hypothetical protein [Flavobacteriales bacterium]
MEHMHRSAYALVIGLVLHLPAMAQDHGARVKKPARYDAAVEAIIVPNNDPRYAHRNPAVYEPVVVIRNEGTDPLDAISIRYGTDGFTQRMYAWNGRLAKGSTAEVRLPHLIDMMSGENAFTVVLGDPNGRKDQDKSNNTLSVRFNSADVLEPRATASLRTDGRSGGRMELSSTRGKLIWEHRWSRTAPDTFLLKEVIMSPGSYVLMVLDSTDGAHASVRIRNGSGVLQQAVRSCGGSGCDYQFRVVEGAAGNGSAAPDVVLFAIPGRGKAILDVWSATACTYRILNDSGEPMELGDLPASRESSVPIDLSGRPAGTYHMEVSTNGVVIFSDVIRVP